MKQLLLRTFLAGFFLLSTLGVSALEQVDSVYQIGTAQDVVDFATLVNNGEVEANAVLTADIDLTGVTVPAIGTAGLPYMGIFDGQGHKIDNWTGVATSGRDGFFGHTLGATLMNFSIDGTFDANASANDASGTIGYAGDGTLIRNVHSDVDVTVGNNAHCGGLVGSLRNAWIDLCSYSGTVTINESCGDSNGGIAGYSNLGYITNCLFTGRLVSLRTDKTYHLGGILGYVNNASFRGLNGCLSTGVIEAVVDCETFSAILGRANTNTPSEVLYGNCWLEGTAVRGMAGAKSVHTECLTAEQLANGYATFMLNKTNEQPVWFQQIGTDPMPVREGNAVVYAVGTINCDGTYGDGITFSNTEGTITKAEHQLDEDGFCTVCGNLPKDEAGFYQISSPKALRWIATEVAAGNFKNVRTDLRITADLDLGGENWMPIGNDNNMFIGTVDGGHHTISNMKVDWDQPGAGLFGTVGEGLFFNLIIDETCSVNGVKYSGGLIGHSYGKGIVNIIQVGVLCDVTCLGEAAAGIIGNANSSSVCNMYRCFTTGAISAEKDAACFSGWLGNVGAKVVDCWSISEVTNYQEGRYLARHGGSSPISNCFSAYETQGTHIEIDDVTSGKLTWLLNYKSFINPLWYQTLGEDDYPVWDNTHGLVYEAYDETYACVKDDATYQEFVNVILDKEKAFVDNTIATRALLEEYRALIDNLAGVTEREAFFETYKSMQPERDTVEASAAIYASYAKRCDEIIAFLDSTEFEGKFRGILESYLYDEIEPNDEFVNGSYLYVWGAHLLTNEQITNELSFVEDLLKKALAEDYQPGAEITSLIENPLFDAEEKFAGWNYEVAENASFWTATVPDVLTAVEGYSCEFDINQTLTGLKNGIYMLEVNGAFRAHSDIYNDYHAAMAYMNGNANYLMMESEDVIAKDAAIDGENCLLSGDVKDYTYIMGESEGYVPYGPVGCAYAFKAGRYVNRVAAEVTDGTLTIGVENPGTGIKGDWVGFGNVRLFYLGNAETANETLDIVLQGYVDRANTISKFVYSWAEDFSKYPNHAEALKTQMAEAVAAVPNATDANAKLELVAKFSEIFKGIYECRQAYVKMIQTATAVLNIVDEMLRLEIITQDEFNTIYNQHEEAWTYYTEGSISAEQAYEVAQNFNNNDLYPNIVDGAYQLASVRDVNIFAVMVNGGMSNINAVLTNDLDFTGVNFTPIGWGVADDGVSVNNTYVYRGTFDGQGHTISNLLVNKPTSIGVGFFGSIAAPAKISNLRLDSTCAIIGDDRAGLVGRSTASGDIYLDRLANEGTVTARKAAAGILGNANDGNIAHISNSYSTGAINQSEGKIVGSNCVQICGWFGSVGGFIDNCWSIAPVTGYDDASRIFCRTSNDKTIITNSYSISGDGSKAQLISDAAVGSGELTYKLNQGVVEEPVWRQTLGEGGDLHPVLDSSHQIVYLLSDGTYANTPDGTDAITDVKAELGTIVNVYDAQGRILRSNVSTSESLNGMPKGFYILKGQNGAGRSVIKQ